MPVNVRLGGDSARECEVSFWKSISKFLDNEIISQIFKYNVNSNKFLLAIKKKLKLNY